MNKTRISFYILMALTLIGIVYLISPIPGKVKPYVRAQSAFNDLGSVYYHFQVYADQNSGKLPNSLREIFPNQNIKGNEDYIFSIEQLFNTMDKIGGKLDNEIKFRTIAYKKTLTILNPSSRELLISLIVGEKYNIKLYHNGDTELIKGKQIMKSKNVNWKKNNE